MSNYDAPLGPGHNNISNIDGSPLSYFHRTVQQLSSEALTTTYSSLLGLNVVHETDLTSFTNMIAACDFFVQGYDNSKFVCFGAIRRLTNEDLPILNSFYHGYGTQPYGYAGYGDSSYAFNLELGELCYVYQDPAYSGDNLSTKVADLLIQAHVDYFTYTNPRHKLVCMVPTTIPTGPQYDYMRHIIDPTVMTAKGITLGTKGTFDMAATNYHNINLNSVNILTLEH